MNLSFLSLIRLVFPGQLNMITTTIADRNAFLGLLIIVIFPVLLYFLVKQLMSVSKMKLTVTLTKSRLYFPQFITITVSNNGKHAVDIDNPHLVFSNFFLKRNLKLKGINGNRFYPLWLDPGGKHELKIDLGQFYGYDPNLKKFPKVTVHIRGVNGKTLASHHVMLRKTLFR